MEKIAYVFPGQGTQYIGMGYDFYQKFESVKKIYNDADEVLGYSLTKLCFEGPIEKLSQTQYAQPAILTTSIAYLEVLKEKSQPTAYCLLPTYLAGHSLGEYSALVAAGGLEFKEAVAIVQKRAQFMQEEAEKHPTGMMAILGLERNEVERICREESVEVANINCPGQIVISGMKVYLEKAAQNAVASGAKRAIPLAVNGAFHSSYMLPAQERLAGVLARAEIKPLHVPVVANVTARPVTNPEEIRESLTRQISGSVLWEDSVRFMLKEGITTFIEIGPGEVLKGLIRKIDPVREVRQVRPV